MFGDIFGGFLGGPSIQCSKCNAKIMFGHSFIPKEGYCENCGLLFNTTFSDDYKFPNIKFDKDGRIIKEEK